MKFLVALMLVTCVLAQDLLDDDEPTPTMNVWLWAVKKGDRVRVTCGPCDAADDKNMVTLTMEKCASKDSCTPFYKMVWEKGTNEAAPPPLDNKDVKHDIDVAGLYINLNKPNGQCADAGMYKCECGGKPFYGNVKIDGC